MPPSAPKTPTEPDWDLLRQKKPTLNTEHIESIAELSEIYLQPEAAEFSGDDLISSLRALYELSKQQSTKMSKAHAKKIQKMVIGAQGVFGRRGTYFSPKEGGGGKSEKFSAHSSNKPLKSEHIATEDKLSVLIKNAKTQADALRYFDSALKTAERINEDMARSEAFSNIAISMAQAGKDPSAAFDSALKAAEKVIDDTFRPIAFRKIAEAMSQAGKFGLAVKTADSLTNAYQGARAFSGIAISMAQAGKDPSTAFDSALKAAEGTSADSRGEALNHIITAIAQMGKFDLAIETAERITDEIYRPHAFSTIAAAIAQTGNFDLAFKTVERIRDDYSRSVALGNIAAAMAQTDKDPSATFRLAIKAAEHLYEGYERAEAFGNIAAAMARAGRFDSAIELTECMWDIERSEVAQIYIKEDVERSKAFSIISISLAQVGKFDLAIELTERITVDNLRFKTFTDIATAMAQAGNFDSALKVAERINDDDTFHHLSNALCSIAAALAQAGHFDSAIKIAERITEKPARANAFGSIAAAMAKSSAPLHEKDCKALLALALKNHDTKLLANTAILLPFDGLLQLDGKAKAEAINAKVSLYSFFSVSDEQQKLLFKEYKNELLSSQKGSHQLKLASRILANLEGMAGDSGGLPLLLEAARASHDSRLLHTLSEMDSYRAKDLVLRTACTGELDSRVSWLLIGKLIKTGYLDSRLEGFYAEKQSEGFSKSFLLKATQKTVSRLNLTPNKELISYFLSKARDETQLEGAFTSAGKYKEEFDRIKSKDELAHLLAKDLEKSLLFYILNAGKTHYSLVNNYDSKKFATVLNATEGLRVHMPTLEKALSAFPSEMHGSLRERLLAGSFPLGGSYSRNVRVDVSNSAQLETVEKHASEVFGKEEIGVILKAGFYIGQLAGTKEADALSRCSGLADAAAAIAEIEKTHADIMPALEGKLAKTWKKVGEKELLSLSLHSVLDSTENKIDIKKTIKGIETQRKMLENTVRQKYKSGAIDKMLRDENIEILEEKARPKLMRYIIEEFASTKTSLEARIFSEWETHLTEVLESFEKVAATEQPLSKNKTVALSYLDKRADIVECLRFADAAQCCFTSTQYIIEGYNVGNAQWIARIWKDPLFFVFGIFDQNSADDTQRNSQGFVFGSISVMNGAPAILLNGVYMEGKTASAVQSILSVIEQDFARPLGCKEMFVAARHGGSASLGADYSNDSVPFIRLRAIADKDGEPETKVYDDLITDKEGGINKLQTTDDKIWHKKL